MSYVLYKDLIFTRKFSCCYHLLKLVFIVPGLCFLPLCFSQVYHVVNERKSWTEAQRYCRETYTDLVTINSTETMAQMKDILRDKTDEFWIGLYDGQRMKMTSFRNFNTSQSVNVKSSCVTTTNSMWNIRPCSNTYPFICSGEPTQSCHNYKERCCLTFSVQIKI
uniref:C-type lectin domain-containing protein n=1 Tax=Xiphophorus couchianus TaxID=32473 RepID=A0A3B5L7L4_9TELE